MERAARAAVSDAANRGRSETTTQDRTCAGASPAGAASSKIGPNRGLLPPALACWPRLWPRRRGTNSSSTRARETTWSVRTTSMRRGSSTTATSGPPAKSTWPEHHPNPSPTTWAPNGPRSSGPATERKEMPPPPDSARLSGPLEGGGHHPGGRDGRQGVDGHARRCLTSQLPGEGGDGPLGAAVGAGIGGPPPRSRGDAEDAAVARRGHQRQGGVEHVEVALEVHGEHRPPVLLGAPTEVGLPGDAGDVDDGIEPAVLVHELPEQGADRLAVGHRHGRRPGRATGGHDPTGRRLHRLRKPLGPVEGHQGVDGDDEPPAPAQLLGDSRADPAPAAGDDGDPLAAAHGAVGQTSSSRPSRLPASSHCSSSSR